MPPGSHDPGEPHPTALVPGAGSRRLYASALLLRAAFADIRYDIHHTIAAGNLVAVYSTMSGRHVGPLAGYTADGRLDGVFPPTGKSFAMTQSHWFRFQDGLIIEHWANRDDLGMASQLGWVPPRPGYLVRMALAKRRAKRRS